MVRPASAPRASITESPWYWVYLFCAAGLVALLLAGPKFAARQVQIERNLESRQVVAQLVAGHDVDAETPQADAASPRIPLWPLYLVLGTLLAISWFNLYRARRRDPTRSNQVPGQPTVSTKLAP